MCFCMRPDCPCCRQMLHHCERCWDKYHNGEQDHDYDIPKFYGEVMCEDAEEKMRTEMGIECNINRDIIADKNRKYVEGEYH